MATYNAYTKALKMLKDRENYYGKTAETAKSYVVQQEMLSMASAYHSAWWILYYAIHDDWECLDQFDYYSEDEDVTEEWACTPETVAKVCEV